MRVHTHLVLALNFVAIVALRGITLIISIGDVMEW